MSNVSKVRDVLTRDYNMKQNRTVSIFRTGSDSPSMTWLFDELNDHVTCCDHADGDRGYSMRQIFEQLGLEMEQDPRQTHRAQNTQREYKSLAELAQTHFVSVGMLERAKWTIGSVYCPQNQKKRPAFIYPTEGGIRHRYSDGLKPKYSSVKGYKPCFYGLKQALQMAVDDSRPAIILCNGELSTLSALEHGLPAFCQPSGEKALDEILLKQLKEQWQGMVWVALDCDETGRRAAKKIQAQLGEQCRLIDLGLTEGGDLADFCGLYEGLDLYAELGKRIAETLPTADSAEDEPEQKARPTSSRDIARQAILQYSKTMTGKPLVVPFQSFHTFGGMAKFMPPQKMTLVFAPSSYGKTSFLETWVDYWLQDTSEVQEQKILWYGSEWSAMEYHWRRVSRLTGIVSYEDMLSFERAKWDFENQAKHSYGRMLSDEQERAFMQASEMVANWRNSIDYYPSTIYLEDMLAAMGDDITELRRQGVIVAVVVIDYIQLTDIRDKNASNKYEEGLRIIKLWSEMMNVHVIVGSQTTKTNSADTRANKAQSSSSMQFIRDEKPNLLLSLNIVYQPDYTRHNADGTPMMRQTDYAYADILKNSGGKKGRVHLRTAFHRLMWRDEWWDWQQVNLGED